ATQARQLADEFKQLSGAKTCRACGQPLTAQHFDSEKKKRDLDATVAERKSRDLFATATAARQKEDDLTHKEADARERLEKLREHYKDKSSEAKQAKAEIEKLVGSCKQSYIGLPEIFKEKVSPTVPDDWSEVSWPERHELTALRADAAQIDDIRRKLRSAQDTAAKVQTLRAKLDSARDRLAKL